MGKPFFVFACFRSANRLGKERCACKIVNSTAIDLEQIPLGTVLLALGVNSHLIACLQLLSNRAGRAGRGVAVDLADGVNRAIASKGYPTHDTEAFKYFVGDGIPKMIERALPPEHRTADEVNEIKDIFLPYYAVHYADNTYAYAGMPELINTLKNHFISLHKISKLKNDFI